MTWHRDLAQEALAAGDEGGLWMENEATEPPEREVPAVPSGTIERPPHNGATFRDATESRTRDPGLPATANKYPQEVHDQAVRLVLEHRDDYENESAAIRSIASEIGCSPATLRNWVRQAEQDSDERTGLTSSEPDTSPGTTVGSADDTSAAPPSIVITPNSAAGNRAPVATFVRPSVANPDPVGWKPFLIVALVLLSVGLAYAAGSVIGGLLL